MRCGGTRKPRRFGFVDFRKMEADARALLAIYDLHIDPASELGTHSVAVQQIVAGTVRSVRVSASAPLGDAREKA